MRKCRESRGIAWITFVVLVLTIAISALFIWDGYMAHVNRAKLLFDQTQVSNAIKAAKVQYMQDGFPDGITYYFDAEGSRMTDWSKIGEIKGYGRSDEKHNTRGQTGALGIPNLGGKGGAQLLAITMEDEDTIFVRWQGQRLTYYDYDLMTEKERSRLTKEQWRQIELDVEKSGEDLLENKGSDSEKDENGESVEE